MKKSSNQTGFGVIELIVIIAVIAVIMAVGWLFWKNFIATNNPAAVINGTLKCNPEGTVDCTFHKQEYSSITNNIFYIKGQTADANWQKTESQSDGSLNLCGTSLRPVHYTKDDMQKISTLITSLSSSATLLLKGSQFDPDSNVTTYSFQQLVDGVLVKNENDIAITIGKTVSYKEPDNYTSYGIDLNTILKETLEQNITNVQRNISKQYGEQQSNTPATSRTDIVGAETIETTVKKRIASLTASQKDELYGSGHPMNCSDASNLEFYYQLEDSYNNNDDVVYNVSVNASSMIIDAMTGKIIDEQWNKGWVN